MDEFEKAFEIGDDQAIHDLNQILVQLQCSLLTKINNVNDKSADLKALARAADQARDNAITALMQLRRRLQQAELEGEMSGLRISTELPPPPPIISDAREVVMSPTSHTDVQGSPAAARRVSALSRRESETVVQQPAPAERVNSTSRYDGLSPASSNSADRRTSSVCSVNSVSGNSISLPIPYSAAHPPPVPPSVTAYTTQPARRDSMPAEAAKNRLTNLPSSQLSELPKPNRKNNYLGFCKCAWKLQGGEEKAFVKSSDWSQRSANSSTYSLACDRMHCKFKSPHKSSGNPNVIWNKLVVNETLGIKYRWSFLAKSHVTQKTVESDDYSYQCQFCVFMGIQVSVMNLDMLLEHISVEHRTQGMSDVILDRTSCVSDRICRDGEKFDINLFPTIEGVEADAFITPVPGDVRDPLARSVQPVEKYGEAVRERVYELYAS